MTIGPEFEILDFEKSLSAEPVKTIVRAVDLLAAMESYLPWPSVDLTVKKVAGGDVYMIIDNQTDFKYEVTKVTGK